MGYAERVLQPGETVAYRARLHWIIYLGGLVFVAGAIALAIAAAVLKGDALRIGLLAGAALLLLVGLWRLARAWIASANTEVVVTSRRLIYKVGFLSRSTVEMNLDKVESVLVRQGLMGRMLDFGSVIVRGVGAGLEPIPNIAQPLQLHRYVCGPGGARAEVAS
ncbi:MAG: PH domain-containing protein [Caulobacteraceae bacterium]